MDLPEISPETPAPITKSSISPFSPIWTWTGVGLALAGFVLFVLLTPPDLLDKLDYIAAAVCHRIASHSFFIHEHQLPLCQRCSGTFPGALTGLLIQWGLWRRRRSQRFPTWPMLLVFAGFAGLWGLDGINSYTTMILRRPEGILGYAPQPWIRLFTGVLMGSGMSAILAPAFNQTMWADGEYTRALRSWRELAFLVAIELALGGVILTLADGLLYPIAVYSAIGVLAMFTTLGSMMFVMLLRRDRVFTGWRNLWLPLVWGLVFAFAVIITMNFLRIAALGTTQGVPGIS
ncbi:MAG: DUF2085 domain-containing protein [Anaerolineae bacterium]|nr:DUF2085 domain-containing protein [Anaerolineae bacterium]